MGIVGMAVLHENTIEAFKDVHLNKICITQRYRECESVFHALSDIDYAVIKCAILSKAVYGDIAYRKSGDIDLLINRENIDLVKSILLEKGFVQGRVTENGIVPFSRKELLFQSAMSHQTAPFIKQTNNLLCPYINVDINMDIMVG